MGILLATVASLLVLLVVSVVVVQVARAATGTGTPRRREFNRAVRERHELALLKSNVQIALDAWRPSVTDEVGIGFLTTIQDLVTDADRKLLTEEKNK